MSVEEILIEIENLIDDATNVMFTNKLVIAGDELIRLLDELRDALPEEIKEAARLVADRQHIVEEAQREAQRIVEQAKVYGTKLTDEHIIVKQAEEQANELMQQAQKEAHDLQANSVSYASEVFRHLEGNLQQALEVVRHGHSNLQGSKKES